MARGGRCTAGPLPATCTPSAETTPTSNRRPPSRESCLMKGRTKRNGKASALPACDVAAIVAQNDPVYALPSTTRINKHFAKSKEGPSGHVHAPISARYQASMRAGGPRRRVTINGIVCAVALPIAGKRACQRCWLGRP